MQERLEGVLAVVDDRRVLGGERHGTRGRRHRAAVDLGEEVGDVVRLEIDDLHGHRFVHARADALADGVLGPLLVAPSRLRDVDDMRDRVVLGLEAKVALYIAAARVDRVRRADIRRRRHRGDVAGHRDERAGGSRPRPGRRDEGHDRNACGQKTRRDLVRRVDEPAGRVDHEDDRRGVIGFPVRDHAVDVARGDRIDLAVDVTDEDRCGTIRSECGGTEAEPAQSE